MELQLRNEHKRSIFYSYIDENVSPPFEKEVNGKNFNLFSNNPCIVTYHRNGILTRQILTLKRGFSAYPVQNGSLSKLDNWSVTIGLMEV